ncbi:alpha/beta fold hydrolase [Pelomonas sp. CA6]|uniref:esterase/lipase family protein n=1 Tax=Pelomonas sp. CA6 TaxID=2907999 RepID=UPI001F4AFCC2|nr:alpha/beta fold hydrolase [Pelomonas sp. CA6]MCH7342848.1 alpha/beta fold hydrolase [Pelomonas sp. CA6]
MLEGRAPWEYAALLAGGPWLRKLPRGDGHPVLVFPGLAASDFSTRALRRVLERLGYPTRGWGLGLNVGPRHGVLERCHALLQQVHEQHGGQPVSLLGWSLGGIYAREIAKRSPQQVRNVITLGTPFTGHPRATHAWRFYDWVSGLDSHDPPTLAQIREAPPCPTTSIFSRSDGVVSWQCSVLEPGPLAENIVVPASHMGLPANPLVMLAIADRLAQPREGWKPLDPQGLRRYLYRRL